MRNAMTYVLLLATLPCLGQKKKVPHVEGSTLLNLRAADTAVYYRYELDSVRTTYVKFDKRGRVTDYYFELPELPALNVDSTQRAWKGETYTYALVDGNGNRIFNAISCDFGDDLVIGGYHGDSCYGRNYHYYKRRLFRIDHYASFGKKVGVETIYKSKKGYKVFELIHNEETPEVEMIKFDKKGNVLWRSSSSTGVFQHTHR